MDDITTTDTGCICARIVGRLEGMLEYDGVIAPGTHRDRLVELIAAYHESRKAVLPPLNKQADIEQVSLRG